MNATFLKSGLVNVEFGFSVWVKGSTGWREVLSPLPIDSIEAAVNYGRLLVRKDGWKEWAVFEKRQTLVMTSANTLEIAA